MEVRKIQNFAFRSAENISAKNTKKDDEIAQKNGKFSSNVNKLDTDYIDPLMKWPVRGLAYMNEIGVAISEVAPALGQALWIPTLMYLGADIYDKYKNNDMEYEPSGRRGAKQALFQGLASVTLPTCAVIVGQKLTSLAGAVSKSKLSLNTKEKISNYAIDIISAGHLSKYAENETECKDAFKKGLTNVLNFRKNQKKLQDGKSFFIEFLKNPAKALSYSPSAVSTDVYAEETISNLIKLRKELLDGGEKTKENIKWHNLVDKSILKGVDKQTAVRDALVKYQKSMIAKGKVIKTVGGFIALGLTVKPIDNFVEHVILKKYIEPGLDKLTQTPVQENEKFA